MEKFNTITSTYPLPIENVDTDQIIPPASEGEPARFGDNLFGWR